MRTLLVTWRWRLTTPAAKACRWGPRDRIRIGRCGSRWLGLERLGGIICVFCGNCSGIQRLRAWSLWRRLSRMMPGRRRLPRVRDSRVRGCGGDAGGRAIWFKLDAASVAVPTVHHHAVARQLLAAGVDCLVEKPLAATLAEADELIGLAEKHGRILQVGHLERFNPAVLAIEPKLTRPMFFEAHRLSVFTPRSLDVDVVLDLMIHDLDIVLTFARSPVREVRAVGLPVLSPKVDIANVRVEFESGCVANFTASRVSTERVRKLRFFEPRQYVSIDYARRDVLVIGIDPGSRLSRRWRWGRRVGFRMGCRGFRLQSLR